MASKQRCPKCNQLNDPSATRCIGCNTALIQVCPYCGHSRPWYVPQCSYCAARVDDATAFTNMFRDTSRLTLHGHYVIQETVSAGKVSTIYRAASTKYPGRTLAIKELSTVALFRTKERRNVEASFQATLKLWSDLKHPNLAAFVDSFVEDANWYVVTDFVDGWSLRSVVNESLVVTPELARNWGSQLCQLLGFLHAQVPPRFVPYLAPHHVMVSNAGVVKLIDWGLTSVLAPESYGPFGSIRGYMASELKNSPPTPQSDVFALGRLLYAVLTGQLLEKGVQQPIPLCKAVPGISPDLVKALAQATDRDPATRPTPDVLLPSLWPAASGTLQPIPDWVQRRPALETAPGTTTAYVPASQVSRPARPTEVEDSEASSMADLGFVRDGRFSEPRTQVRPAQPAAQVSTAKPRLAVQPHSFAVSGISSLPLQRLVLTMRNAGDSDLVGRVTSHVDWLSAPQKVIQLLPGQQAKVILSVHTADIPAGSLSEPQALSVDTNGGQAWVGVSADTPSGPTLIVEQVELDFGTLGGSGERTLSLTIRNAGRQPLAGTLRSRVPWLRVPPGSLRCAPGQSTPVAVQLVPDLLPLGQQTVDDALLVDSDGGQQRVRVRAWRLVPALDVGTKHMDFGSIKGGELAERLIYVRNAGDGTLEGQARTLLPWLQVSPTRFTCPAGESAELVVHLDSVGLEDGDLNVPQALRLQSNGGNVTLSLLANIRAPRLVLGTQSLDFHTVLLGQSQTLPLVVRNAGSAPLTASLQTQAPWLTLSDTFIECAPNSDVTVRVRADTNSFARGQNLDLLAAVRITADSTVMDVPARLAIIQPMLRVEPEQVDFGYIDRAGTERQTLSITNDGNGALAWNATTNAAWVELSRTLGVCEAGQSQEITLTAYGLALESEARTASATLVINSDGGRVKVELRVGIAAPQLDVDTRLLDLGPSINMKPITGALRVFNRGLGLLTGSVAVDRPWLVPDRLSFECATGRSIEIHLTSDMDEFPTGMAGDIGMLQITSNGGNADVRVALDVLTAPEIAALEPEVVLQQSAETEGASLIGHLTIKNVGLAAAHIVMQASASQLVLSRSTYEIKPGKSVRVRIEYPASERNDAGSEALYVTATSGTQTVRVPVRLIATTQGTDPNVKENAR